MRVSRKKESAREAARHMPIRRREAERQRHGRPSGSEAEAETERQKKARWQEAHDGGALAKHRSSSLRSAEAWRYAARAFLSIAQCRLASDRPLTDRPRRAVQ